MFRSTIPKEISLRTGDCYLTVFDDVLIRRWQKEQSADLFDFSANLGIIDENISNRILFWGTGYGEYLIAQLIVDRLEARGHRLNWWFPSFNGSLTRTLVGRLPSGRVLKPVNHPLFFTALFSCLKPTLICTIEHSGPEMAEMVRLATGWAGIPVVMASAKTSLDLENRIDSEDILQRLSISKSFRAVTFAVTEDQAYGKSLLRLGLGEERIALAHSVKWHCLPGSLSKDVVCELRKKWLKGANDLIWIAGSVHHERELCIVLKLFGQLRDNHNMRLILAPSFAHHGADYFAGVIQHFGFSFCRWSQWPIGLRSCTDILLVDGFGDLGALYSVADLAFVGGSFEPGWNGHNVIEPVFHGVPTVTGISHRNFRSVVCALLKGDALQVVSDEKDLYGTFERLACSMDLRRSLAQRALGVLADFKSREPLEVDMVDRILRIPSGE